MLNLCCCVGPGAEILQEIQAVQGRGEGIITVYLLFSDSRHVEKCRRPCDGGSQRPGKSDC